MFEKHFRVFLEHFHVFEKHFRVFLEHFHLFEKHFEVFPGHSAPSDGAYRGRLKTHTVSGVRGRTYGRPIFC